MCINVVDAVYLLRISCVFWCIVKHMCCACGITTWGKQKWRLPNVGIKHILDIMLDIHAMALFTPTDRVHKSNNPAVDYQLDIMTCIGIIRPSMYILIFLIYR